MSRTYRNAPHNGHCFRNPRGHAQALINEVKPGKIPPGAFDDVSYSHENFMPNKAARRMAKKGMGINEIANHIAEKFHLEKYLALEIAQESIEAVERKAK